MKQFAAEVEQTQPPHATSLVNMLQYNRDKLEYYKEILLNTVANGTIKSDIKYKYKQLSAQFSPQWDNDKAMAACRQHLITNALPKMHNSKGNQLATTSQDGWNFSFNNIFLLWATIMRMYGNDAVISVAVKVLQSMLHQCDNADSMLRYDKYMNGMSVEEDDFPMKHSEFLEWLCVQRSLNTPVLSTVQSKTDIRDIGVFTYLNNLKRFKEDMKGIEMTKYFGFKPKLRKDGVPDEIPYIQDICCLCHLVDREYETNIQKTCTEDNCQGDLIYRIDIELITVALCHIAMLEYVGATDFADDSVSLKETLKYNRSLYNMTLNEKS